VSAISGLESQTADLHKKVTSLEATIKGLEESSEGDYEVPTYNLTINSAKDRTIVEAGFEDDVNKYLYITMTVKNTSSSDGYISYSDFQLKNSSNEKRPNYKEHPHYTNYYDPSGSAELLAQSLSAGDTAKGTLLFIVGVNDKDFTLEFNNKTYNISVD
jgi:hypothetical protein